jgi:quinol monooxygenase YgiN
LILRSLFVGSEASGDGATVDAVIIVSGWLRTADADRDRYLRACEGVIVAARKAEGCIDFSLAPDPIESGRINVYECWASIEAAERFRGSGPDDQLGSMLVGADVQQHEIASSRSLT